MHTIHREDLPQLQLSLKADIYPTAHLHAMQLTVTGHVRSSLTITSLSATHPLRLMPMLAQRLHDHVAMVALDFDHAILHGSARTTGGA